MSADFYSMTNQEPNDAQRPASEPQTVRPLVYSEPAPFKPSPFRGLVGGAAGALIGGGIAAAAAALFGSAPQTHHRPTPAGALLFALAALGVLACAWIVTVAVHEAGHAVVGALSGLQLTRFTVGPLRLSRTARGWRPGITRGAQRFTGSVSVTATEWRGAQDMRRRWSRMVLAGPAMNLVLAAVLLALLPVFRARGGSGDLLDALLFTAVISVAVGLLSLMPSKAWAGGVSDGEQLRRLRHRDDGGGPGEVFAAAVMLSASAYRERPRDWDKDVVAVALRGSSDRPTAVTALNLLHVYSLDRGDVALAGAQLQQMLDLAAAAPRPGGPLGAGYANIFARGRGDLAALAAIFEAVWRGDAAAGRAWLARAELVSRGIVGEYVRQLACAAVAWSEGDVAARGAALERLRVIAATGELLAMERAMAPTLERIPAES